MLYQLLCEVEIQVPVSHAWLDHRSLKPFVEGGDGNPIGIAGDCSCPAFVVGRAVVARDDIRSGASRHSRIIIPRQYACRPDFLCMVRKVIGVDFGPESLVNCCDIPILDAPVGGAEEMQAIEDTQQADIGPFSRPDR